MSQHFAQKLNSKFATLSVTERVQMIAEVCENAVFTTSLGKEDQYLTWAIARSGAAINIVTLETGRLFQETLDLLEITRQTYSINIAKFEPNPNDVADYVSDYGIDGFYDSLEARKACCHVRKVIPLNRALSDADGWITGLTREQSDGRGETPFVEYDADRNLLKFNPIADLSIVALEAGIIEHEIPVSALHARGYPSIGCEPCTRAIKPGEHIRAGRWWWEQNDSTECGLHVADNTKIEENIHEQS